MRNRSVIWLSLVVLAVLLSSCGPGPEEAEGESGYTPAADLGLKRKGLSPSEVDLPCSQSDAESDFKVVSCRVYRHMGETVHMVGEVENTTDQRMGDIQVQIDGYNKAGGGEDTKVDGVFIEPVWPGERGAYRIFFDARDAVEAKVTVSGSPTDAELPPMLEVSGVEISGPSQGYTHVTGQVNNPGSEDVKALFIALLRDEDGVVVEVHRERMLKPIPPGTSDFDVMTLHHGAASADASILVREE